MKKYIFPLGVILMALINLTSCQINFDKMSDDSISSLKLKLQSDPTFASYEDAFQQHIFFMVSQRNVKQSFDKNIFENGIKSVTTKEEYFNLCRKAGIVNPEEQMRTQYQLMLAQQALFKKYPEISKMTRQQFSSLMEKSNKEDAKLMISKKKTQIID